MTIQCDITQKRSRHKLSQNCESINHASRPYTGNKAYICIHICIYACVYIYIYVRTQVIRRIYVYIYIYIYIRIQVIRHIYALLHLVPHVYSNSFGDGSHLKTKTPGLKCDKRNYACLFLSLVLVDCIYCQSLYVSMYVIYILLVYVCDLHAAVSQCMCLCM